MRVCIRPSMDGWKEHEVTFAPAEGLSKNETSVHVLQDQPTTQEHTESQQRHRAAQERAHEMGAQPDVISAAVHLTELEERKRTDPGYKFLMMVAAFSRRDMSKMTMATNACGRTTQCGDGGACPNVPSATSCLHVPEVTGVVQMSASVYGHVKEAEQIVHNSCVEKPLVELIESPMYAPLFARLVAIRIALSDCMSSSIQTFDGNFKRLHQEQSMVLRALRKVRPRLPMRDWTRPIGTVALYT